MQRLDSVVYLCLYVYIPQCPHMNPDELYFFIKVNHGIKEKTFMETGSRRKNLAKAKWTLNVDGPLKVLVWSSFSYTDLDFIV